MATVPLPDQSERDDQVWAWLERRYREHGRQLHLFALGVLGNREDAEDATQIALLKAHRALVRGHRPSWPRAWLFAITLNVCRRVLSTRGRGIPAPLDPELRAVGRDPDIPTGAEISRAVRSLPPEQREVFLLREMRGLSYEELSERLDLTPAAAGSLLARARKRVRDELAVPGERLGKRPLLGLPGAWTALRDALQPTGLKLAGVVGAAAVAPGIAIGVHGAASRAPAPASASPPASAVISAPVVYRAVAGSLAHNRRSSVTEAQSVGVRAPARVGRRSPPSGSGLTGYTSAPASTGSAGSAVDSAPPLPPTADPAVESEVTTAKTPRSVPSPSEADEAGSDVEVTDAVDEAVEGAKDAVGGAVPTTDQLPTVPAPETVTEAVGDAVPDLPEVPLPKPPLP